MNLSDLCHAPCLPSNTPKRVPEPGRPSEEFVFHREDDRKIFSIIPCNHDTKSETQPHPKVALVGLSPARTQIESFTSEYLATKDYQRAARHCSFRGLVPDIIAMLRGLGVEQKLGLKFVRQDTFDAHPDIWTSSLVKCATLTSDGSSSDFDPSQFAFARACMNHRLVPELLSHKEMQYVFVLGKKAWHALDRVRTTDGTVRERLETGGKILLNLPHPSGENGELVRLAKYPSSQFPSCNDYVERAWSEYRNKPPRPGRKKQSEQTYKQKRMTAWQSIFMMREKLA